MKNILIVLLLLSCTGCSLVLGIKVNATNSDRGVNITYQSNIPVSDINQGTIDNEVPTGVILIPYDLNGRKIGDEIPIGFNSSQLIEKIKMSRNGSVFISYDEIYWHLREWYLDKNKSDFDKINTIRLHWSPVLVNDVNIPVICNKLSDSVSCSIID